MYRRITTLALALGALGLLGACQSSTSSSSAPAATRAAPPTSAGAGVPAEPGAATTTTIAGGGAHPDSPYCQAVIGIDAVDEVQGLNGADPATVKAAVKTASDAIDSISAAAPAEISAQWGQVAAAYTAVFDAYAAANYDFTALMADPKAASVFEGVGAQAFVDASNAVEQYTEAQCGSALGLGASGGDLGEGDTTADTGTGDTGAGDGSNATNDASLTGEAAKQVGSLLLDQFSITATPDQQECFGRAVSDPSVSAAAGDVDDSAALSLYKQLATSCGIDASLIPG